MLGLHRGAPRTDTRVPDTGLFRSLDELAVRCGVAVDVIGDVARRFATAARGMCITHTGVSHTPTGTIAEWLATVLNAVTNRLDQPGGKRIGPGYIDPNATWS